MKKISKVYGFDHYGDADVFEERHQTIQTDENQPILVKIERIGINPVEAFVRSGKMSAGRPISGFNVIGGEVQGEIIAVENQVTNFKVGDKVLVKNGHGGYAEYLATNEKKLYLIPEGMDLDEAGAFSAVAATAYWALYGNFYSIKDGDTLGIVGASGSVGSFILQLVKHLDKQVTIIAVASEKNKDYLLGLGANVFIDYTNGTQIKTYAGQVDYVMDASLFNAGEKTAMKLVKDGGTYLGMTTLPRQNDYPNINIVFLERNSQMTNDIAIPYLFDFYKKYGLDIKIAYRLTLSLEGVKEAHNLIEGKRASGKIILSLNTSN